MSDSEIKKEWDDIEVGEFFVSFYKGRICHSGIKLSDYRYFSFKDAHVFGFADNKKPTKKDFPDLWFRVSDLEEVKNARS